jgi:hypothetical protein
MAAPAGLDGPSHGGQVATEPGSGDQQTKVAHQ